MITIIQTKTAIHSVNYKVYDYAYYKTDAYWRLNYQITDAISYYNGDAIARLYQSTNAEVATYDHTIVLSNKGYLGGDNLSGSYNPIYGYRTFDETVQTVSETLFLAYYKCSVYSDIKGYYAGGYNGTYYQNVQSFSFFTETMTNANSLSATRAYGTGISSTLKGYYCGGTNGTITNNINTMTFDTEATVSIATVLTRIDYSGIGINSNTKGYYCGGYNNGTKIDVINFTNDACALLAAALPVNRNSASGTNSTLKGYISGSQNAVNSIDGITFATEATATIAATLITGRSRATGINSSTCGYNIGGNAVSEIDGINFANDTTINPANYFSVALTGCAGVDTHKTNYVDSVQAKINSFAVTLVSDNSFVNHALTVAINAKTAVGDESAYDITSTLYNKGYIANAALYSYQTTHETSYTIASSLSVNRSSSAGVSSNVGGYYASGTGYSSVDGITFATEAYYAIVATLYAARTFMCGISGLIKGYYAGGQNSGTGTTTIQTIAYDSNTIATLSATLTVLNSSSAGVNSGVAGYVCGGSSSPRVNNKIVFATDTCAAIMSSTRNYSDAPSGTNSSTAGYIGGGNSSSAIDKLLFATDSITTLSATLVIAGYAFASVNSNDKGFTVGGFGRLGEVDAIVFATDTIYDAANFVTSILYGVATDTHKANYINSISTKVNSLANATVVSDETSYNHSIVVNFNQIVLQEMPYYGQLSVGIHLNTIPSDETTYDNTFSMPNKGYIKNGDTVYAYNTDGENSLVITATLNANGNNACGVYSGDNGYYCGSSSWSNIVDKINFASETTTKSIGTLSATRGHSLGICAIAKGYICGGQNSGTVTNVIQTLTFASETISTISATMPIANEDGATTFNVTVGYMCGGYHNTSNIFKLSYATELCSTLVAVLHNKDSSSGTMSQVAGYVAGGYTGDTTAIDKLNFATESIVELTARISVGGYRMSSISGITNGYVIGGIGRSYTIDSINFATDSTRIVTPSNSFSNSDGAFVDTHNNINVNVVTKYINSFDTIELVDYSQFDSVVYAIHETHFASDESYYSMEFVSGVKGYIAYGTALYGYGTVTEYSFLVSATLAANRQYSTGVYSSTNGYFTGGYGYLASIEGFVFSTESCYAVGASLSAGRARIVGNESLVKGYYCGGNGSSVVAIATIQALTFSNDTVATLASSQPNINYNGAGVSSSTDGYICGGDSNANVVYKLNFVSEICSTLSASITTRNTQPSGTGSSVAGYIVGGNSSCSIAYDKILYANDTVSVLSATIPIIRGGISGVSSATNGYNVGGGTTIDGINFVTDTSINIAATLGGSSSYTGAVDTHNAVHVGVNKIVSLANIAMFEETYYSHVNIYEPILQLPATSDQTSYDHVNIYEPILQLPATSDQTSYDHAITIETRGYLRTGTAIYRFNSENDSVDPSTFSIADGIGGKCSFYSSNNGYYIGGGWSYATNAISFASETTYDLGNILYANWYIYQGIGISGIVKGYTCGGYDYRIGNYTNIQAMTFASQTMQLIANTVGNQNGGGTGVNSNIKGYFTNDSNVLNALTFATDSCVSLGVSFAVASIDYSSGTNSSVAGYFAGNSSNVNTISKITFADESRSTLSATLIVGGGYMAAVNCATLGYNVSGNNRSGKIDAINFATDTVVDKGYTSYTFNDGGNAVDNHKSSMSVVNTIYINSFANILLLDEAYYDTTMDAIATRTILSDETSYDHSIVFSFTNKGYLNNISSTAIYSYDSIVSTGFLSTLALTQSGSIKTCYYSDIKGYYCGGNWNNYIEGIQFTNETTFSYANKLFNNYAYYAAAGVSSTTKGYHIAGYTNSVGNISYIQALTFATDTNTYIGNMPVTMAYITGTMSSTNSYISYSTTMYRFSFSSETGVSLGAILAVNRQYATGTMSNVCGYYSGGNSGGSSISRITFATEACATISAVLVTSGYTSGAVNNATTGYNIGGINRASEIDGLTFATETMVNYADALGAIGECYGVDTHKNALVANTLYIVNLNQIVFAKDETYYYNDQIVFSKGYIAYNAGSNVCYRTDDETNVSTSIVITGTGRYIIGSGLESIARGYYCGGSSNNVGTSTCYNNIEVINYATESNFAGTFTLTNPRSLQVGISTYNKGFIFGGANANVSRSDIETLTFATEATSVHTITLSRIERAGTGVNSDAVGYYCGGVSNTTRIEGLVFVSETIATKTATCSVSRDYSVGVSSNVAGYVAGNSSNVSSINKLLFADETVSTSSVTLVAGRYGGADINTLYKGYFVGGTSSSTEIDGIDYATETSINPANILGGITYCSSVDTKPMVVASASPLDVINDIANVLLAQDNSMFGQISVGLHSIPMLSDESYFDSNVYAINHTTDIVDESYYTPYIIDTILSILYTKGYINNDSTSIYGYDTSNESAITVSATITNTASLKASFYSHNKGYWTGGGWSANTDSINFATLTTVNHGNVVYAGTYYYAGVGLSSTDYGYMLGGYDYHYSPSYANSIQRFNFSTNTFALVGYVIPSTLNYASATNGTLAGYVADATTIYKLQFANDTNTTSLGTILSVARNYACGTNSNISGYYSGNSSNTTSISKITFATETCAVLSATLATGGYTSAPVNSGYSGYNIGGNTRSGEIDSINFASETVVNNANVLTSFTEAYGVNTQQYGDISINTQYISNINQITMINDYSEYRGIVYISAKTVPEPVSYYDYIVSITGYKGVVSSSTLLYGYNTQTETAYDIAATLAVTKYGGAGVNSDIKGYYAGNTVYSSAIEAVTFSTLTRATLGVTLGTTNGYIRGYIVGISGYGIGY